MGGGASIPSSLLPTLTVEEVGDLVAGCGDDYVAYRSSFIDAGIDGQFLHRLDERSIHQQLIDLGIHDEEHIKTLEQRLLLAKSGTMGDTTAKNDFELRGVTIALFRAIVKEALERNPDKSYWNMGRVSAELIGNHEILKPDCRFGFVDKDETLTFASDSSLIEMLRTAHHEIPQAKLGLTYNQGVGTKANVFVSFAYGDNFIDLVEGLGLFLEDEKRDPTTTYFWFDMFVNDQWHALDHDFDWWANTFSTAVESIGETVIFLSPWDQPGMLKRAWCLFEISCSKKVSVAISRGQKDAFVKTLRNDMDAIYKALCTIDLEKATSYLPEDMERISAVVRAKEGGFHYFNVMVVGKMRGWVEETAKALVTGMGMEDEQLASDLLHTANLLKQGGKFDEAKAMYERALLGYEKAVGSEHPSTLGTIGNLAILLYQQGKLDEAKVMYERALAGQEKALGQDHPDTLGTVNNLANLLKQQGKLDEAKTMYERALLGYEKSLGPNHINTLETVNNLGLLLKDQGKNDEAKAMFEHALSGNEKSLGPDHINTLATVNNLANLLKQQGKLDEAKGMYERALSGQEKTLGQDHPNVLNTVNNLAILLYQQGELDKAKAMFERALAGSEKALGPDHPYTIVTVNNLANLSKQQGKVDEAKTMYERALVGYEKALGPDHTNTLLTSYNLANLLKQQDKLDEAKTLFQRCYEGYAKVYGADHSDTLNAQSQVEDCEPFQIAIFPPDDVALIHHRNVSVGRIFSDYRVRFNNFNTVIGDVHLVDGKYYYEIEVLTMGQTPQFGWATEGFERTEGYSGNGVGDDTFSWGFDGHRIMKWNGEGQPFGKAWVAGDVLGLAIDLVGKSVSFSVNGDYREPCGVAFSNIDVPAGWIMPALTSQTGTYRVNFGDRPFIHPPPDESYQSVASGRQPHK